MTAAVIAAALAVVFLTSAFWVNWWWYDSMGYRGVLVTRYLSAVVTFLVAALLAGTFFAGNLIVALRRTRATAPVGRVRAVAGRIVFALMLAAAALVALVAGLRASSHWELWQLWLRGDSFGVSDPVYHRDVGFYFFALPAIKLLQSGIRDLLIVTAIATAVVYILRLGINIRNPREIPATMRIHVFALLGLILLGMAVGFVIANYELVYSSRGVVFGASYTDVHAQRPANWLLAALSVAIGGLLVLNAFVQRLRWLIAAVIAWGVVSVVVGGIIPPIVQQTVVEPSELKRERPYIANHIAMSRSAYGLDQVDVRPLSGQAPLTAKAIAAETTTIANIRLWDYRIIRGTYQQLQSFVPYYVFPDVDVERYQTDSGIEQVLLSARELDLDGLPDNAQTWTNTRLVYTHGYAVVVSPVEAVSPQGLPTFLVGQIPPNGQGVYRIDRPEIYFGEATDHWVIVNTDEEEFSGLIEDDGSTTSAGVNYEGAGKGSIELGNYLKKILVAANIGDRNILLSDLITGDSRVLIRRNLTERISDIAPFLRLDPDPYLVIADGRLYWIVDAYTHSDRYPHATRLDGDNYLRNSVKVVVDAYDGTTTFYRTASPDPLADAYGQIFDDLFRPIAEAPPAVALHFRYPEHLYEVQSDAYAMFHVTDPTAFYNGEDRWAVPVEQSSVGRGRMVPYFVTMTLPGESEPDFALIRPFTPGGRSDRQNMTAWMAGRASPTGALSLVVYRFPRQVTVFGPSQIEARINQEPEISSQVTLWNQSGSEVIYGNLLVIPIGESLLYVQPLYLQATETPGALPELKRVIVASNERVVMRDRLDTALAALTATDAPTAGPIEEPVPPVDGGDVPSDVSTIARQALDAYNRAQEALSRGDWAAYGAEQAEVRRLLEALAAASEQPATPDASSAATPVANPVS